jgi:hypothetical protein
MNNNFQTYTGSLRGIPFWVTVLVLGLVLSSLGLGWLVKSIFIFFLVLGFIPIVVLIAVWWWWQRKFVSGDCPSCGEMVATFANAPEFDCNHCNEKLSVVGGKIQRVNPPDTIDVTAVEI